MIETDFFKAKKEWSKVKDELLGYYLKLYFAKIFATGKPVAYIDCFAGKGKYDDEKVGSPLLAMQLADEAGQRSKTGKCNIYFHFIEQVFAQELKKNLTPYTSNCYEVYDGGYNQHFANIVNQQHGNIFAYVDPFGIKFLDFNLFCMLA